QCAVGPDRERLAGTLPGLLWLGFILTGLLGVGRAFVVERENDCWEALRLAPGDKSAIYVGKLAGNLLLMLVVEAILVALFGIFFNLDLAGVLPALAVVIGLGTVAFAPVGTLFAQTHARGALAQAPGSRRLHLRRRRRAHLRVRAGGLGGHGPCRRWRDPRGARGRPGGGLPRGTARGDAGQRAAHHVPARAERLGRVPRLRGRARRLDRLPGAPA